MHVFLITASQHPYSQGPAAEICAALPKSLRTLDMNVSVLSPLYREIDPGAHSLARRLTKVDVEHDGERYACELYTGRTVAGVSTLFIGQEQLFHDVDSITDGDDAAIARRAAVFAKAAVQVVASSDVDIDVVHAHGWVGASALTALAASGSEIPRVLTVHDRPAAYMPLLTEGARCARKVTVGSSRYASELEKEFGLQAEIMVGIADGIDPANWNPITDAQLPARFDPVDLSGKRRCKAELQRQLGLPVRQDVPLLGVDGRPGGDDGLALLVKVASQLLRNDVQLAVFAGKDEDGALIAAYEELWDRWPDRIQVRTAPDTMLRHRLYGGADLALVGHRDAPSGADAMRAHRYGVVPVVHQTGALADTVVDCDANLETGTGFLFSPCDADALLAATRRAFAAFALRDNFTKLAQRVMRVDHSWDRSARLYERLYASLFEEEADAEAGE